MKDVPKDANDSDFAKLDRQLMAAGLGLCAISIQERNDLLKEVKAAHTMLDRFGVKRELLELVSRQPKPSDYHTLTLSQRIEEMHRNLNQD